MVVVFIVYKCSSDEEIVKLCVFCFVYRAWFIADHDRGFKGAVHCLRLIVVFFSLLRHIGSKVE